jgi:hypothetical protein
VPLDRSCAALRGPVGPKLRRVAGSRWVEAVYKTVDCLPGTQLRRAHASKCRWVEAAERTVVRPGHPASRRVASARYGN